MNKIKFYIRFCKVERQFERYGEEHRSQLPYSSEYVGRYNR